MTAAVRFAFTLTDTRNGSSTYDKGGAGVVEREILIVDEALADHLELDEHLALAKELAQRAHILSRNTRTSVADCVSPGLRSHCDHLLDRLEAFIAVTLGLHIRLHAHGLGTVQIEHLQRGIVNQRIS